MKNEKPFALTKGLNTNLENKLTMENHTTTENKFQYECDFCQRELPSGGHRFAGFGACPRCYRLAHLFVDALRGYWANYFNNLGVRK